MVSIPVSWLMPGGRLARHQVLIFHRVLAAPDPMMPSEPDVAWFDATIGMLARRFNILPLSQAVQLARQRRLPRASLSITFDDGYADNLVNALPVLERHCAHATFFIAVDYLDGGRMWNDTVIETARRLPDGGFHRPPFTSQSVHIGCDDDRRRLAEQVIDGCKFLEAQQRQAMVDAFATVQNAPLPSDLMLTTGQLRQLDASEFAEIGGHTCSHPILANCDTEEARQEIEQGAQRLADILGRRPRLFAYPNGKVGRDYLPEQSALVDAAGFEAAVATDWGVLTQRTDRLQIPRFTPWSRSQGRFMVDLLRARYGLM